MAKIPGSVPIGGFIAPTDSTDVYATHDDLYGRGGYKIVDDLTARDAIPSGRRKEGAPVYVKSEDKEYRLVGGITNSDWVSNSSNILISVTYAELVDLIDNSGLIAGQKYLLSDYTTTCMLYDYDFVVASELHVGELEPIILTATTTNSLYTIAISTIYPDHIIYYDYNFSTFSTDLTYSEIPTNDWKGGITYRKDPVKNIEFALDYLNVKYRRWAVIVNEWDSGSSYDEDAWVQSSNILYYSLIGDNTEILTNRDAWSILGDISTSKYLAYSSGEFIPSVIGFTIDPDDYEDFNIFQTLESVSNINIVFKPPFEVGTNIVFMNSGKNVTNITINHYIFFCTFLGQTVNLTINNCYNTIFMDSITGVFDILTGSIIGDGFNNNIVGSMIDCKVARICKNNTLNIVNSCAIGENFQNNTVSGSFKVKNGFSSNTVGNLYKNLLNSTNPYIYTQTPTIILGQSTLTSTVDGVLQIDNL